jgi:signal transduction histidine kinase
MPLSWTLDAATLGIAALSALAAAGLTRLAVRRARVADAVGLESDAVIAASGAFALVWPADDDGQGWGAPQERSDPSARAALAGRAGVAADATPQTLLDALCADAPPLRARIAALRERGEPFKTLMQGFTALGRPHGAQAVLWLTPGALAEDVAGAAAAAFPVWRTDADGVLLWANAPYLTSVEAVDLDAARAADMALDMKAREDARAAAAGAPSTDTRAVTIDGRRRILRIALFPAPDGATGMAFDLTEDMERGDALAREARAYAETLNHLNDAVAVFNGQRRLVTRNRAFARLWGLEEAWLDEQPGHGEWLDRLRALARIPAQSRYAEWKERELSFYREAGAIPDETWSLPDGRILRVARQRQPDGGLLLLFEDISDTISLQARYKTQVDVQRATLDKLGEAVAVFGADGKITLANIAFARLWELEADILAARPDFAWFAGRARALYPDEAYWSALKARVSDPSPQSRQETQGELRRLDGSSLTWLTRPLPDGATLVAFADVTAAKRVEAALTDRAAAFQEANALKTEIVRNASYQLRTPLTTIKGYGELLATEAIGPLNPVQAEYIGAVLDAAEQLNGLIQNIVDLALIDAGQMTLDLGDVHVADALEETAEIARSNSAQSQTRIVVQCDPGVGVIRADNGRVRQILFNLVSNALRFTGPGDTITLAARRLDDTVRLSVTDTGQGLDPSRQAGAFEGFSDGDRRAGLSLALVKRFVEMHGGWVAMKALPAGGVTVSCHLPAQAAGEHAAPELDLIA